MGKPTRPDNQPENSAPQRVLLGRDLSAPSERLRTRSNRLSLNRGLRRVEQHETPFETTNVRRSDDFVGCGSIPENHGSGHRQSQLNPNLKVGVNERVEIPNSHRIFFLCKLPTSEYEPQPDLHLTIRRRRRRDRSSLGRADGGIRPGEMCGIGEIEKLAAQFQPHRVL